ncbi:MucR family transcriptional regulator, partial [Klebsiella pneumoniae]|uniref:MucR family transcriptional regulator n=1 Tax=Klebsiella pneumoniae TaxID=573 RepID=UPI0019346AC5
VEDHKVTAAQVRKSVTPDRLFSFLDGKPYKSLKRHLTTRGITPAEYRQKYGLPHDYPMVAATYAAQRSELAKNSGLGQYRREQAAARKAEAGAKAAEAVPAKRGRPRKAEAAAAE